MALASLIVVMNKGRIEDSGPPQRVYARPATRFSATFMGESTQFEGRVAERAGGQCLLVETPVGRLPVTGDLDPGSQVTLILRPENIHAEGGGEIALGEAQVREAVFQGAHYRVLASRQSPAQDCVLRLPPQAVIAPGMALRLSFAAGDLVLLHR